MNNLAILVKGNPNKGDDIKKYNHVFQKDIDIMEGILSKDYVVKQVREENVLSSLKNFSGDNLFFYYVGHGNFNSIGKNNLKEIFQASYNCGKKIFVFDSCSLRKNMEDLPIPSNSKVFFDYEIGINRPIAKVIWDYVVARKKPLKSISKESLHSLNYGWVKYFENKNK